MKTNPILQELTRELKKKSIEEKVRLWKRIAEDMEKSTRRRRVVNLSRINRYSKENDTVVVPGKVLGSGVLDHKLKIAAYSFSSSAREKMGKVGAEALTIKELMQKNSKGKNVRLIG